MKGRKTVNLDADIIERLQEEARLRKCSLSSLINQILGEHLKNMIGETEEQNS